MAMSHDENARSIVIIGAGPGGLCMAIKLREAGIRDFVILEEASGLGGTWYHNRYPGLCCDIPSYLYSFSFEPKRDWSRPFPPQPEILAYLEDVADRYEIAPHIRFDTKVEAARWNEESGTWHVSSTRGEFVSRVLISAVGMLNVPKWPDIPGLEAFNGKLLHSARWDSDLDVAGSSLAVIGSAATAVQMAPELAREAGQLYLYQRSPTWVLPRENDPFSEEELARFAHDPDAARSERDRIFNEIDPHITFPNRQLRALSEAAGLEHLRIVEDPEVRKKLTPRVPWGCQRPLFSNSWFPMFNRPNVELIADPIERITEDSIVSGDGEARRVDVIVAATGFHATRFLSVIDVTGRGGLRLEDAWAEGPEAYLGIATRGFPNLFMLYGPNTNNGSIITLLEFQVEYVVRQLARMDAEAIRWMEVRADVMKRYNEQLQRELDSVEVWQVSCPNYYRAASGRIVTQWPNTMSEYQKRASQPDPDAYEVG
jgi:cation diffusion facilitator CzcD-associated flavoprotein CzcO